MKKLIVISAAISLLTISGCTVVEEPINLSSMPPANRSVTSSSINTQRQSSSIKNINAALVWSEKYEKLLSQTETIKKQNQKYAVEVNNIKKQLKTKDAELRQAKKELKEANKVLLSMRLELGQWKKDVLGFRQEMRQSQQALLAASAKILRELGAELREPLSTQQVARNR